MEDFHLNVAQISGHYYGNADMPDVTPERESARVELQRYRTMRGRPRTMSSWIEERYLRNLDKYLTTGRTPMRCHSLRSSCFIDPWGTVYPCITYDLAGRKPSRNRHEPGPDLGKVSRPASGRVRSRKGNCPQCWTACEAYPSAPVICVITQSLNVIRPCTSSRSDHRDCNAQRSADDPGDCRKVPAPGV